MCSWPPYFKIIFPVCIFRNYLLWPHFTLPYEFFLINIWRHNTHFKTVLTYEAQDIKFLPVSAIYIDPTLFKLHNTKIWNIISENLWTLTAKVYNYVVTTLNFQMYLRSFHLATLIVTETVVSEIPNSQTLKYFSHFTDKYINLNKYSTFDFSNSTYL